MVLHTLAYYLAWHALSSHAHALATLLPTNRLQPPYHYSAC